MYEEKRERLGKIEKKRRMLRGGLCHEIMK